MSGPLYGRSRRDASEPAVVEAFRAAGATIVQVSGKDVPDLFVGIWDVWHPVEVKSGNGKLKPGQKRWAENCRGERPSVARSRADALDLLSQWQTARLVKNARAGQPGALGAIGGGVDAAIEENERGCSWDACHCGGKLPGEPA